MLLLELFYREVMEMFCRECGTQIPDNSKFCVNCGTPLAAAAGGQAQQYQAAQPQDAERKKKSGAAAFFTSPAGIALIVILALAVIGGLTVGLVFAFKGSPDNTVDAETVKVWNEYENLLDETSQDIPKITIDQAALAKSQEELKKSQKNLEALQNVLAQNAGTEQRQGGTSTSSTRDIKADQLEAAMEAYKKYMDKLNELMTTLAGANLLDANTINKINGILAEINDLGADVKATANKFLADNPEVATLKIDPAILNLSEATAAEVQASVTAAQNAEVQRSTAEKAAADAAAAAAAQEAARQQAEQQSQQEQQTSERPDHCPQCGAPIGVGGWCETNSGWHCFACGYTLIGHH